MPVQEFGFIKLRAFVGYEDSKNVSPNYIVEFPAFVCRDIPCFQISAYVVLSFFNELDASNVLILGFLR